MSDLELIRACAESNDGAAWNEFVSRFQPAISRSIIRTSYQWGRLPREVVDDLVQDTYFKLCTNRCCLLLRFGEQHPEKIPGYIKVVAVNVARDYFKSTHTQKKGDGRAEESLAEMDPEAGAGCFGGQQTMEREVLLKQIGECVSTCSAGPDQERDCLIFWLYYRQGLSANEIAALPTMCLTAKGVESVLQRLKQLVRQRLAPVPGGSDDDSDKDD
jgi:RNA polymerase sigma-70 factor (ECF subfamily)